MQFLFKHLFKGQDVTQLRFNFRNKRLIFFQINHIKEINIEDEIPLTPYCNQSIMLDISNYNLYIILEQTLFDKVQFRIR